MAARDRNLVAWQAYVIVMSIVAVGLLVGLGVSIASHSNTRRAMEAALERANAADQATRKLNVESELTQAMLGQRQFTDAEWEQMKKSSTGNAQLDALQAQFDKDMSLFGPNEPTQNKNYPKLAETLMQELRIRNQQIDAANRSQADLVKKTESTIKNEEAARMAAEDKASKLEKDLEVARADFKKQIDDGQAKITEISERLNAKIAEFAKEKSKLEAIAKEKTQRADDLVALNIKLNKRVREVEGEEFQAPQGRIVETAQAGSVVYVNLGSADGLRTGVKFGIIDPGVTKLKDARPKAHLEISEILNSNLSKGKVISGSIQSPVVKDDLVYSVVWQKGRKTQFALLGKLDMNGDGLDDRALIKEMILQSGGEISEDLQQDGKSTGQMTVDTNWLVVGESYKVTGNDDISATQRDFRSKFADMQQRAKDLAVSQINLDKLLTWIQVSNQADRTFAAGNSGYGSLPNTMRSPQPSLGSVSEIYERNPLPDAYQEPNRTPSSLPQ